MARMLIPRGYEDLLWQLKERIRQAQLRATLAVNRELVLLYWQIGQEILTRQSRQGWGTRVIDRLAQDLRHEFPEMRGFSPRNLKYMHAFADAYPDEQFVQQVVAQIALGTQCPVVGLCQRPGRAGEDRNLGSNRTATSDAYAHAHR